MSWAYRLNVASRFGDMPMQRCEECGGAIRHTIRLERALRDGQRTVVEHVHLECATTTELLRAARGTEHDHR